MQTSNFDKANQWCKLVATTFQKQAQIQKEMKCVIHILFLDLAVNRSL